MNTGSSGNGGVATSAANGGAVSMENINSGGNVGNAISVGDTTCAPWAPEPVYDEPVYDEPVYEEVVALPATGVGGVDASAIFAPGLRCRCSSRFLQAAPPLGSALALAWRGCRSLHHVTCEARTEARSFERALFCIPDRSLVTTEADASRSSS